MSRPNARDLAVQVPRTASIAGMADDARALLADRLLAAEESFGELTLTVSRDDVPAVLETLRDGLAFEQLMDVCAADYPERAERFEVVYHLLSLTTNRRIRVKCTTDEEAPVPSVVSLWPVAGWHEREAFDLFGVFFEGNPDLRRILTDYGFQGHPGRKDFPLSGTVEMRYSEEAQRVVYEPTRLAQDFRYFDFLSPWEGTDYVLPGDEKAAGEPPKGAPATTAGAKPAGEKK